MRVRCVHHKQPEPVSAELSYVHDAQMLCSALCQRSVATCLFRDVCLTVCGPRVHVSD